MYRIENVAILKMYNPTCYKLSVHRSIPACGSSVTHKKKGTVNTKKLLANLSRAKNKVQEYALCNSFDYFVTLTIDKLKYDRYDLKKYYKDLGKMLSNYNKIHDSKIKYILIPENHKDGAWHMHGLISGILPKHLTSNENGYLSWSQYSKKFGYMSLSKIKDKKKVSSYITKYITKSLSAQMDNLGNNLYYCSKKLNTAWELKRGVLNPSKTFVPDYSTENIIIKTFDTDECLDYINDNYYIQLEE